MNNNILLTFIIPCYGKSDEIVREALNSFDSIKNHKEVQLIFIYKNSDKYNYDWVKDEFSYFEIIFEDDSKSRKINKIKKAIENVKGKYLYVFDSDDIFVFDEFEIFLEKLKNVREKLVLMNYEIQNEKNKIKKVKMNKNNKPFSRTLKYPIGVNASIIYEAEHYINNLNSIKLDYLQGDDFFIFLKNFANENIEVIDNHFLRNRIFKKIDPTINQSSFHNFLNKDVNYGLECFLNDILSTDFVFKIDNKLNRKIYSKALESLIYLKMIGDIKLIGLKKAKQNLNIYFKKASNKFLKSYKIRLKFISFFIWIFYLFK